jgi:hypothetical protein
MICRVSAAGRGCGAAVVRRASPTSAAPFGEATDFRDGVAATELFAVVFAAPRLAAADEAALDGLDGAGAGGTTDFLGGAMAASLHQGRDGRILADEGTETEGTGTDRSEGTNRHGVIMSFARPEG